MESYAYKFEWNRLWPGFQRAVDVQQPLLRLPSRYCETCKLSPSAESAYIPKAVPQEILSLLEPHQITDKMWEELWSQRGDESMDVFQDRIDRFHAITPAEYSQLIQVVREKMDIPATQPLLPYEWIGVFNALVLKEIKLDIVAGSLGSACDILTEKAAEKLSGSGLTGFEIHPLQMLGPENCKLYTVTVYGDGGVPIICSGNGEWKQCPECGKWWVWGGEDSVHNTLDEREWDGSDFFHLAGGWNVFISKRAKEWFEHCDLRMDFRPKPLEMQELVPDLPKMHRPFKIAPPPPLPSFIRKKRPLM